MLTRKFFKEDSDKVAEHSARWIAMGCGPWPYGTMDIMEKISAILADRHLKPADLARMTGFSPSRLSKWFSGEGTPSVYQAAAFAKSLGVPLEWLADDTAPPVPPSGLSEDDRMILAMARAIGDPAEAMRRLVVPSGLPVIPGGPNNSAPGTKKAGEGPAGNKRRVGG